ncbi:hypothetical protein K466DRAFT_575950 [Polyporus arcularius HHB13444]|uniref:Uncharacterized protein n=1 Tax=Polyporus arcularius HHB13444 TaxID=1314778 RepID=A0A5C3PD06_9APHY|nr:hypothetical protein K466DRAFT_575950 [Polyporus arcularius HHB13444]
MKLVVRVQYIGERARLLLREDQAAEYTKGLIDDLEWLGFPMPHEQKPIEKSGFMLCVWHVDRDSDLHHTIQSAFMKSKAESHRLSDRSIRYISLNEDGVMHTTSLGNKQYKPKTYNKQADFFSPNNPNTKPFGKAPKYPTVISQARKAATPLSHRIAGADLSGHAGGSSGYYGESRDVDMPAAGARTPGSGSDSSNPVLDVTQQTLLQLSQSSAFQSLLQRGPTVPTIKMEPAPPPDLSSLSLPLGSPPAQPQIANLQALLQKAGVKSSSAQAFLSAQSSLSNLTTPGNGSAPMAGANATPVASSSTNAANIQLPLSASSLATPGFARRTLPIPISTSPPPAPRGPAAHAATRELWDVRRQISALQARENSLIAELKRLGQPVPPTEGGYTNADQRSKVLEDEITALREELTREQQTRKVSEALLRAERVRRAEVENMMKDATRECKQPFVVPALLDAFMKIGQMTGDALKDVHGSTVPMEL